MYFIFQSQCLWGKYGEGYEEYYLLAYNAV
jgi:hypothetical protein